MTLLHYDPIQSEEDTNMKYTQAQFNATFNDITTEVEYSPTWDNGTGYFDHAVRADLNLEEGDIVKAVSANDRRIIIVGTAFGNAVFFERYSSEGDVRSNTIVSNVPYQLNKLSPSGSLTENQLSMLIGTHNNIGKTIKDLASDLAKLSE